MLGTRSTRRARPALVDALRYPLVTTAHLSTRMHASLAEERRAGEERQPDVAFPAMLLEPMSAWLNVVRASGAVAIVMRGAVAEQVAAERLVVLSIRALWLVTHHGVLSLRGRARSVAADAFQDALRQAA